MVMSLADYRRGQSSLRPLQDKRREGERAKCLSLARIADREMRYAAEDASSGAVLEEYAEADEREEELQRGWEDWKRTYESGKVHYIEDESLVTEASCTERR